MRLPIIGLCRRFAGGTAEWRTLHVPVVTSIFAIALTFVIALMPYAGHAHGLHPAVSLVRPMHAGASILAAADRDEFAAQRSDAAESTWDWRLAGTILTPNLRMALFAQPGKTRAVPEGKAIEGWIVTSVGRDGVTLSAAGRIRVIQLAGMSHAEAIEAARQQTDKTSRANAEVVATARQDDPDDQELDGPMRDLAEATRRMTQHEGRDSIEPSD